MNRDQYPVASQKRWFKSKLFECDCGFGHTFLQISYEDWEGQLILEENSQPSWLVEIHGECEGFWARLRLAWEIIMRRHFCGRTINIDALDIKELRDTANEWLAKAESVQVFKEVKP